MRRLDAISAERTNWLERAENASTQIASLGERKAEAEAERERLADAPDEIDANAARCSRSCPKPKRCARPRATVCRSGEQTGRVRQGRDRRDPVAG